MNRIRSRLTYSNVMVTLLAFLALAGGTAYAMEALPPNSVGTEQLKGYAVTGAKIANSTINSAKLAPNSVTEAAIAKGAVSTGKLPAGAVTNAKIAAGAVDSEEVADHSLTTADLATEPVVATGYGEELENLVFACTHYNEAEVTITAPSAGQVTVSANLEVQTSHTNGELDFFEVGLDASPTTCDAGPGETADYSIPTTQETFSAQNITVPTSRTFEVGPGSHTFYVNGYASGPDPETFFAAGLTALFVPK